MGNYVVEGGYGDGMLWNNENKSVKMFLLIEFLCISILIKIYCLISLFNFEFCCYI